MNIISKHGLRAIIEGICDGQADTKSLLRTIKLLPEKIRIEAILICSQKMLGKDMEVFWEIANLLFPSYWFVKLMCVSIRNLRSMWSNFYVAALSAIDKMSIGYRSISYATLSQSLVTISSLETHKLLNKAINLLPFSYENLAGGSALITCRVLSEINLGVIKYILALANTVSGLRLLDPASKVDILVRIALVAKRFNAEILDFVVRRILSLIPKIDPIELIDIEITVANLLSAIYCDREEELMALGNNYSSEKIRRITRYALMKIMKTKHRDNVNSNLLMTSGHDILKEVQKALMRRAELKKKISSELNRILGNSNYNKN